MDGLEVLLLRRRLDLLESIIERSGLLDAVVSSGFRPVPWPGDPSPDDPGRGGLPGGGGLRAPIADIIRTKITPKGDPSPIDFARLDRSQLEAVRHDLHAQLSELQSLIQQVDKQLGGAPATKAAARKKTR
jgi:hypothetical protein